MTLAPHHKFDVDDSYSYIGKDKIYDEDDFISEIGDVKTQGEFLPQLKIKRWGNEANFSVRVKDAVHASPSIDGDKVTYTTEEYVARFYYLDEGFEFDVTYPAKPSSRETVFSIRRKQLAFYYQPPLTEEQIAAGYERPDDIVGSYAVYHRTKRNHYEGDTNYKCGKAFHIKRPWAEDATGRRVWCDLDISTSRHTMTITLPEDFYETAVYPVLVDPTFGYTTAGGSNTNSLSRGFGHGNSGQQYTASSGDTVTTFHMYTRNIGDTADVGIYDKSGGGNGGATLLSGNVTLTATANTVQWETASASIALTAGNTHFPAYWSSNGIRRYFDTGVAGDSTEDQTSASVLQSTWAENTTDDELVSFYVTYTEGGGGGTLEADSGSYLFTGTAVGLLLGSLLTADSGSYAYAGTDADLLAGATLAADSGSYVYTGTAADLLRGSNLVADNGSYLYTGTDATLTYSPAGDFTLTADSGSYLYSGTDADILAGRLLTADSGSYVYTGTDADLLSGFGLIADSGSYLYSGTDVGFLQTRVLDAESGGYAYTGTDATLTFSGDVPFVPEAGGISVSGTFGTGVAARGSFGTGTTTTGNL